jgi:hypothetical protein
VHSTGASLAKEYGRLQQGFVEENIARVHQKL